MRLPYSEETLDVPVRETQTHIVEIILQKRIPVRLAEEIIDVPASLVMNCITEIVKHTPQQEAPGRIVKQIADTPVLKVMVETVEVIPLGFQERIHEHI